MPAAGIGPVKRMLRSLDLSTFVPEFRAALFSSNADLRNEVLSIASIQKIALKDT
jgi:phosphotransferase system enzyme I (PtsP)